MGEVWLAEVGHQLDAQHLCRADGDIAVACEVAKILNGKDSGCQRNLCAGGIQPVAEDGVDIDGGAVGDDHLFKEAQQHDEQSVAGTPVIEIMRRGKLLEQAAASLDGTGDQLREERDEQRIAEKVGFGFCPLLIDVNHVPQGLEGVEADADRQQNIHLRQLHFKAEGGACPVQDVDEHAGVLEIAQQTDVEHDARNQHELARLLLFKARNEQRTGVGDDGACRHQQRVFRVPIHIEVIAADEQPDPANLFGQQEIQQRHHREKDEIGK